MTAFGLPFEQRQPLAQASFKLPQSSGFASNPRGTGILDSFAKVTHHCAGVGLAIAASSAHQPCALDRRAAPLNGLRSELEASQVVTRSVKLPLGRVIGAIRGCQGLHSSLIEFKLSARGQPVVHHPSSLADPPIRTSVDPHFAQDLVDLLSVRVDSQYHQLIERIRQDC